jgi:hypothetical protein
MPISALKALLFAIFICMTSFVSAHVMTPPLASATCQKNYLDLFSNEAIEMTVAFGYDDVSATATNDLKSFSLFVKSATTPCSKWDQKICGFSIKSIKPHILEKKIFGPDGKTRILKIITDASSITDNDVTNRLDPRQKLQTAAMKNLFVHGLQNSEVTIYMGHSRDGGGPSFEPPKLDSHGHVNYDYYHKNKSAKRMMIETLANSPSKSRLIALLSCSSIRWFSKSIEDNAPASGVIGTTNAFHTVNFEQVLPLLERIFSYQCLEDYTIDDTKKESKIMASSQWKVSARTQGLNKKDLDKKTIENLANYLRSSDIRIRKDAYLEIKSYDSKLYSPRVQQELKNYTFGNTVKNHL